MKTEPTDRLLADGYALSRRLLHKPGKLRQWAIERPVLHRVSGQSLPTAGTRQRQRSRRLLSHSETSRHTRRAGRNTEYGDSEPGGHWYQATRHESQGYRGQSCDRVGAEASLQTQGEGTETKAGEYFAFSPKEGKEEGDESEGGGGTK